MLPMVYLVRHGETDWTKSGRYTSMMEIGLNSKGKEQVAQLSRFTFENPRQDCIKTRNISMILLSERHCVQETYDIFKIPNKDTILTYIDPYISEWNFGDFECMTRDEIHNTTAFWDIWKEGCPNGETVEQVAARCDHVIEKIVAHHTEHVDHNPAVPGGDVLLIAHEHSLRVLAARWVGLPPEHAKSFELDTSSISVLGYNRSMRVPVIKAWNVRSQFFNRDPIM
ncbi:3926_t:CDS:2 [Paraglomus occultum]|uniref:3926_t:CDS:1 n=1 Tax=Paraglomus occultum TaxID=144539 RepID=A0A9N8VZU8_9GLOM|nr:3926_t:CDS:2 [Paraglomus occultum]